MAQTSTTTTAASSTNFKVSRQYNSEPWAILITLASIIIVATAIAIIGIVMLWDRYRRSRQIFQNGGMATAVGSAINNAINGSGGSASATANSAIPVSQMPMGFRPKEYEVQSLDMFVPVDDRDDLGEVMVNLNTKDGIRSVHQVKQLNPLEQQYKQLPQVQHLQQMHQMQQQLQQQQLQLQQMQNTMMYPIQQQQHNQLHHGSRLNYNSYSLDPNTISNLADDNINNNNSLYKRVMHYSKLTKNNNNNNNNMMMNNNSNYFNSPEFMEQ